MESEKSLGVDGEHRTADTVALEELEVAGVAWGRSRSLRGL